MGSNKMFTEKLSYLDKPDAVQPFELMLNPSCCTGFLRVVHHHKRLIFMNTIFIFHLSVVMQQTRGHHVKAEKKRFYIFV